MFPGVVVAMIGRSSDMWSLFGFTGSTSCGIRFGENDSPVPRIGKGPRSPAGGTGGTPVVCGPRCGERLALSHSKEDAHERRPTFQCCVAACSGVGGSSCKALFGIWGGPAGGRLGCLPSRWSSTCRRGRAAAPISWPDSSHPLFQKNKITTVPWIVVNRSGGAGAEAFLYVKGKAGEENMVMITLDNLFTTPLATGVPFRL